MPTFFEEFAAFVNAQPDDRPVNHDAGWDECAVGDFAHEVKGNRAMAWELSHELFKTHLDFRQVLRSPKDEFYGRTYKSMKLMVASFS